MSENNVVTTSDIAPVKVPKSFNELKKTDLVAAANHFGTETEGNVELLKADLLENGVTFEQYLAAFHPTAAPEPEPFVLPEPVDVEDWPDAEESEVNNVSVVTVPQVPEFAQEQKYLIRFIGENPYFEFGKYKFTSEKPYGVMTATDAQRALVEEPTKFRQAFPAELEEFYS